MSTNSKKPVAELLPALALGLALVMALSSVAQAKQAPTRVSASVPSTALAGGQLIATGEVSGSLKGITVALQRNVGGGFQSRAKAKLASKGAFRLAWVTPKSPGPLTVRVVAVRGKRVVSTSRIYTVRSTDEQGFVPAPADRQGAAPDSAQSQLGAGGFDNARIADVALAQVGQSHGECKQAANDWVSAATGGTRRLGGGYYSDYVREGGIEVGRDAAAKGDIIQLNIPGNRESFKTGMHTAVVVGHGPGSSAFDVVDSNFQLDGVVRRHTWDPYAVAARYGLEVHIWRLGDVASQPAPPPPAPPQPPQSSYRYQVYGTGSFGLRERTGPGCSAVWNRLTDGGYVSDFYINTPNIDSWTPPIPQC